MTTNPDPNHPLTGKTQSKEHIQKRVEARRRNGTYVGIKGEKNNLFGKDAWNKGKTGLQTHSEKTKELMRIAKLGKKQTPEHIHNSLVGRMKTAKETGYYQSEQRCNKLSKSLSGRVFTEEWRKNMSNAWQNDETRNKHIIARSKIIYPFKDSKPEKMMQIALSLNGVKFEKHKAIKICKSWHQADIFIEPNICIEVDGDYWHANPEKFKPDHIMYRSKIRVIFAKDIIAKDVIINHKLTNLGYFVIRLWESDINKNTQGCAEKVINMIKSQASISNRSI